MAVYRSDYTEAKGYYPTLVASYEYDPWGKVTSVKGSAGTELSLSAYPNHIAHVNPIRYRGYYYDNETGFYYLQSRYYDPAICRFINADSYASNGMGLVGYNMFSYCLNNAVIYKDVFGYTPTSTIDIDGDGEDECYVYEYNCIIVQCHGDMMWSDEVVGRVYIFTGVSTSYFEDSNNLPSGFNSKTDLLVGDFTNQANPCMYAYQAQKVNSYFRGYILDCMLQYDKDFNTAWNRTKDSLLKEWKAHMLFWGDLGVKRAQNVDFDNNEEGKGYKHFFLKAVDALL